MIQLERHIEILLLDNDCVIVPGLGGFVTHHVEARYDAADNTFLPPLRTLGFNPQLRLNDSLLAQSYVEAYDLSFPEAQRRIESEVTELKAQLVQEGSYELGDVGVLSLTGEGKYLFEPCEAGILTPCLYGLGGATMPMLSEYSESSEYSENSERSETSDHSESPKLSIISEEEKEERTIKIKVSWLRNAVAVAAAIIAYLLIAPPVTHTPVQEAAIFSQLIPQPAIASPDSSIVADSMSMALLGSHADSLVKAETAEKAEKPVAPVKLPTAEKAPKDGSYCIVMASHVAKKGAETYVRQLHSEGYDQAAVYEHDKVVRVVYGNYQSEAEAYNELRTVRGNKHFEQSWVYKKR